VEAKRRKVDGTFDEHCHSHHRYRVDHDRFSSSRTTPSPPRADAPLLLLPTDWRCRVTQVLVSERAKDTPVLGWILKILEFPGLGDCYQVSQSNKLSPARGGWIGMECTRKQMHHSGRMFLVSRRSGLSVCLCDGGPPVAYTRGVLVLRSVMIIHCCCCSTVMVHSESATSSC